MQTLFPKKQYIRLKNILLSIALFGVYFCLAHAGIRQEIYPFAIGFFISLIWCNQNKLINTLFFTFSNFLTTFSFYDLLSNLFFAGSLCFIIYILKKKNKHLTNWQYTIISCILLCLYIPVFIYNKTPILNIAYTFLLAILFYLSICKCIKTLLTKGINIKLNLDEIICACFILIAIGCGLSEINILNIPAIKPIGIFLIFISAIVCSTSGPLIVGACLGVGYTFNMNGLNYIAILTCFALCSIIFKNNKYFLALSLLTIELLLGLYFKVYGNYNTTNFLIVLITIIIGLLLPQKIWNNLQLFLNGSETSLTSRNIIERTKRNLSNRFLEISNAFFEIGINFKNTIKSNLPKQEAIYVIKQELCKKMCLNCKNKDKCLTILKEHTLSDFDSIIDTAFQKQKISILDVPHSLTCQCSKINLLINNVNNLILSFNNFIKNEDEKNSGKILICEQIEGFHKMFLSLSKEIHETTFYDFNKEEEIIEDLNYKNIHVKDVVLNLNAKQNIELSLLINDKDIENPEFLKTLNSIFKQKLEIINIQKSVYDKYNIVLLKQCAKYDCIYGISASNKYGNDVCGDNFTCIKLSPNKVLFAICDGMGNGEKAKQHSSQTISLIENFYKAGFPDENIIEIVNKFITFNAEDVFSALDIAVINLDTGKTDFIKVGSQESFIKEKNKVDLISGDSLPIGIIKDIKPSINTRIITSENIVFMCSDGAIDCIGIDELTSYIERTTIKNPQTLCDEIINLALNKTKGMPKDDITVMAFKLFIN